MEPFLDAQRYAEIRPKTVSLGDFDPDIIDSMSKEPKYCIGITQQLDKFVADIMQ